jgi:hypothetical protein
MFGAIIRACFFRTVDAAESRCALARSINAKAVFTRFQAFSLFATFSFFRALILFLKRILHFRPKEGHARFLTTEHRKYKFHLCNCPSRCNRRSRRESRTLDLSRSARRFSGDICMRLRRTRLDYCNF